MSKKSKAKTPKTWWQVTWVIAIEAKSPEAAARRARQIQLDPDSLAMFFDVCDFDQRNKENATMVQVRL